MADSNFHFKWEVESDNGWIFLGEEVQASVEASFSAGTNISLKMKNVKV
jgi:hypothetical protein